MSNVFSFRVPPPGFITEYFQGNKGGSSTSTVTIPPEVLARYNAVNARAEKVATDSFQKYGGEFVAGLSDTQKAGIQGTTAAANQAQPYFDAATDLTASGAKDVGALTQEQIGYYQNPYTQAVVDPTLRALEQQQGQQRSQQQTQAIKSGGMNAGRSAVERALLSGQQGLATSQAIAPLYQQGYQQAVQTAQGQQGVVAADLARRMQAGQQIAGLGTGAQTAALQGAQAQMAAGQVEQQTKQAADTAEYQQFLQERGYPYQQAQFLANIAMGTGALSGSTTTTQQPGGFFSDKRLKEDVKEIGKTNDGQPIYSYKYKGDDRTQIGLMAQDVEKKHPEAVGVMGGYKTVDYKKATEDAERPHKDMGGGLMPNNFDTSSMGGAVMPDSSGEGFMRGGYVGGGLVGGDDWSQIIAANKAALGVYGGQQPMGGGNPGAMGGLNIPTSMATPKLVTASAPSQQRPAGLSSAMQTGKDIAGTYRGGKEFLLGAPKSGDTAASAGLLGGGGELKGKSWGGEFKDWWNTPSGAATGGLIVPRHAYAGGGMSEADEAIPYDPSDVMSGKDPMEGVLKAGSQKHEMLKPSGQGGSGGGSSGIGQLASGLGAAKSLYGMGTGAAGGLADLGAGFSSAGNAAGLDAALGPGFFASNIGLGAEGASAAGAGLMGSIGSGLGTAAAGAGASIMEALPFLAMFSDARVKDNIRPVGKTFDGQNIYSYNIGEGPTQMGLMAQEVLDRKPEAVGQRAGLLTVDYDRATEDAQPYASGGLVPRQGYDEGGPADTGSLFSSIEKKYELPEGYLNRTWQIESGGGKNLYNEGSKAAGHFQFIPGTQKMMGLQNPYDLSESADATARLAAQNREYLRKGGVEEPTAAHLYLAHQQGPLGATRLLNAADRPAGLVVGEKAVTGNRGDPNARGLDFANQIMAKYEGTQGPGSGPIPAAIPRPPGLVGEGMERTASSGEGKKSLGDTLTSEGFVVPALGFLGSMLASDKRNLGQALGEGIMGGVGAYQSQKKTEAEMAKGTFDLLKDRYTRSLDVNGNTVYHDKYSNKVLNPDQLQEGAARMLRARGVDPTQYGFGPITASSSGIPVPTAPTAPVAPGASVATPGSSAETKNLSWLNEPPEKVNLYDKSDSQLIEYAKKWPTAFSLTGERNPAPIIADIQAKRARAAMLNSKSDPEMKTEAATLAKSADEQQIRLNEYLKEAVSLQSKKNQEWAANDVKSSAKHEEEIGTRLGNHPIQRDNLLRLSSIYADYAGGRSAQLQADLASYLKDIGIPIPKSLEGKTPNYDEAMKIATETAFKAVNENALSRAPKAALQEALAIVAQARLDPGAAYALIGRTIGEMDYIDARDRAYLKAGRGTVPARFNANYGEDPNKYIANVFQNEIPVGKGVSEETRRSLGKKYGFEPKPYAETNRSSPRTEQTREAAPAVVVEPGSRVGEKKQFKQGPGVWDGSKWVPEGQQ